MVHVDEFTVGGKEQGKKARSYDSKKKKAIIAVELSEKHKAKRVYVKSIDEFCFRINRSQFKQSIFHKTIGKMVIENPLYHKNIK